MNQSNQLILARLLWRYSWPAKKSDHAAMMLISEEVAASAMITP
jgi:hypothetical protein